MLMSIHLQYDKRYWDMQSGSRVPPHALSRLGRDNDDRRKHWPFSRREGGRERCHRVESQPFLRGRRVPAELRAARSVRSRFRRGRAPRTPRRSGRLFGGPRRPPLPIATTTAASNAVAGGVPAERHLDEMERPVGGPE